MCAGLRLVVDTDTAASFSKNFERHFTESRHAFGMRALGLPNTKHFYEITRIEDALAREYIDGMPILELG